MKKRLLIGVIALIYLVFCCAGLGFAFADNPQETTHFVHVDGHSDEYHSANPGKQAIKVFFSKVPVNTRLSSGFINPVTSDFLIYYNRFNLSEARYSDLLPVKESRYLYNCTFLI